MQDALEKRFKEALPKDVDFCSLRYVREQDEVLSVRQDVVQPVVKTNDEGAMVTVLAGGGLGYAATCDLSRAGLVGAIDRARRWAEVTAPSSVFDYRKLKLPHQRQEDVRSPEVIRWSEVALGEKLEQLVEQSKALKIDDRIVDWEASVWHTYQTIFYLTSQGGRINQERSFMVPGLRATANAKAITQSRSLGGLGESSRQGGLEVLERVGFTTEAPRIAMEALELLGAPNCPSGKRDLLLAPDQMILQIHESIGHPIELDRILGDERNYAGTSFVTMDMFGSYQYGSDLLNVAFDPTREDQFATYSHDDEGCPAQKQLVIEKGILQRPLGGLTSQARAGMDGVACARANGWNRPPIDRMANLNLEVGDSSLEEMIRATERGIIMKTNCSWSIDDSRNKFQFGCEWARLIEDGQLTKLVRSPGYRGISATFWRNLAMVGDESTFDMLGTPFCGKGEPNQIIRVGHASPSCLFSDVDVFGGGE